MILQNLQHLSSNNIYIYIYIYIYNCNCKIREIKIIYKRFLYG